MRKITGALITGGGGFLGSHIAESLLDQKIPVVAVDNFCTGLRSNRTFLEEHSFSADGFQFFEKDVNQEWSWAFEIKENIRNKISHVFHFASPASPPNYQRLSLETMWVNSVALDKALDFSDELGARLVFASTSEIYGDPEVSPQPESYWGNVNTVGPRSCYDEAKRFGESLIYSRNAMNKTKHGLVRIFNTYGPRMNPEDGRVIVNFLVQALAGEKLSIYGDGSQTRSFCYVDDLVSGILKYAETDLVQPINIGNNKEFTILELAETVREIFEKKKLAITHLPLPKDDPKRRCPDLSLAKKYLNHWEPKVSLKEGLMKMLQWLEQEPESGK